MNTGVLDKRFGALAIEKGFITKEQLLEAMRIQLENEFKGIGRKLIGSILYELGYMEIGQINTVLEVLKEG